MSVLESITTFFGALGVAMICSGVLLIFVPAWLPGVFISLGIFSLYRSFKMFKGLQ